MRTLVRLARLQFISASVGLYIFGASWAIVSGALVDWPRLLLGYLIVFPGHLSVSFSNDYFDVAVDRFGRSSFFSGGSGVLVSHPELRKTAWWIAVILIVCSLLVAVVYQMIFMPPWWFLVWVLFCNLLGWFYAAPPVRLSYRGLGEIASALTSGILVPGLAYVVAKGTLDTNGLVFVIPLVLYGFGYIFAVEIPDIEADRLGGKRTWVSWFGRAKSYAAVAAMFAAASFYFIYLLWLQPEKYQIDLRVLGLFSLLPLGASLVGVIRKPLDPPSAARMVNGIVLLLAACFFLMDGYFILSAF